MISPTEEIIEEIRQGNMVIVTDDDDRENEGDFVMAAELTTPEDINFMAKHGRGMICLSLTGKRCEDLDLNLMVGKRSNNALHGTAFTVTIDAIEGTTTGISAADRAYTIQKTVDPNAKPASFARPGHIFPLRAADGGVLRRAGHTEAVGDLCRLAGLPPAGPLCEIMNEDGTMARMPQLEVVAKKFGLKIGTISDLIEYRRKHEKLVYREVEVDLPTKHGHFNLIHFRNKVTQEHHLALVKGDVKTEEPVLVRVHSECLTGDAFGSMRCDCGDQLAASMRMIQEEGRGVVLYMNQEGRGIGLSAKLHAYELQDKGLDTVEANEKLGFAPDLRDYGTGALILKNLGIHKLRLITNNPKKIIALNGFDLEMVERIPLEIPPNEVNAHYLETKRDKMGHMILK
ncbi:MAG: bifunctional 3,4-dihydroxy-2-butanone-4-phosphate synthase/GTP cyclohydrolase II [Calditrichaeota bacterium]|nr:bifunctional 3,4-dihydroxy-2-butanone-4-phosphate synthase/GTP cyclohydrolase II [Calditrichota bacterium]MBT7789906.1 bifunctional 3,4-dihydroxy-2-butanone-4-phosphate synthase/GTP cyclohydrolase II [Calditrichota bacterium]